MKKPGILGNTEASTMRRFWVPWTSKSPLTTPPLSRFPIGQVHEAWWPQALSLTNWASSASACTALPGSSSSAISPCSISGAVSVRTYLIPSTTDLQSSPEVSLPSSKYRKLM